MLFNSAIISSAGMARPALMSSIPSRTASRISPGVEGNLPFKFLMNSSDVLEQFNFEKSWIGAERLVCTESVVSLRQQVNETASADVT